MELLNYLNENFFGPFEDGFLVEHFQTNFGVDVKISGDLFLFKYDQIEANWNKTITSDCRGTILKYVYNVGWEIVSRPWRKFHNLGEFRCSIKRFEEYSEGELWEKLDGSCIQVYNLEGNTKYSTLGSIDTTNVADYNFTFSELFARLSNNFQIEEGCTALFELCTPYNQIVTKYETERVYFLGVYNNNTGEISEKYNEELSNLFQHKPTKFKVKDIAKNEEDLLKWVEEQSDNSVYGKNPEGFVLYLNSYPIAKIKNRKYLALHHIMTGDSKYVMKNLVRLFFTGKLDDVESELTDLQKEFLEKLKVYFKNVSTDVRTLQEKISKDMTKKDYALAVQGSPVARFQGYFFELLGRSVTFLDWLNETPRGRAEPRFEAYMDVWKAV
jgi:T4 RnlA family RNA ligase